MNLYKGTCNGEPFWKKANDMESAKRMIEAIYRNKCGHANVTDIKLLRENVEPGRKRKIDYKVSNYQGN